MNGDISYCNNIDELTRALGHKHTPENRRMFTGSSKLSLSAVQLHNGNDLLSIPVWSCYALDLSRIKYETSAQSHTI
jgi:hypothetical protein